MLGHCTWALKGAGDFVFFVAECIREVTSFAIPELAVLVVNNQLGFHPFG